MTGWRIACVLLAWLGLLGPAAAAGMQQAFLVQNSGWMEPFYTDPSSPFKALVAAVVRSVAQPDDNVWVAAFNQATPDNPSPNLLIRGAGGIDPAPVLAGLRVATKNRRGALADTDFQEAIAAVIAKHFNARPGIIWIFTNNRNSPNNDAQTAARNREFYRLLHLEPSITRTLAFPLRMPVQGKVYRASGMMVYALAYGQSAGAYLNGLVESGRVGTVFTNPPARLKPLDVESIRVLPRLVTKQQDLRISQDAKTHTLQIDLDAASLAPQLQVQVTFENLLYPYRIGAARPSAALVGPWGRAEAPISPERIADLPPGEPRDVTVTLPLPAAQVPSPWSLAALRAMGKQVSLSGVLEIQLQQQQLALSDRFTASLAELFPGDPLSDVFQPPASVVASIAKVPVLIRVQYPLLPVIVVAALALLLLAALLGLAMLAGRTRRFDVVVDGAKRAVAVKAFRSAEVRSANGDVAGRVRRGLGGLSVVEVKPDHSITVN